MAAEIERKFLVGNSDWYGGGEGLRMVQGYLCNDPARTVRVRVAGEQAWITIKGATTGITRREFEFEISPIEAAELLSLCLPSVIDKTRYRVPWNGHVWEIDVFHGENDGLVLAEVELATESDCPEIPPWGLVEVSSDPRYFNSYLAGHPFRGWDEAVKE